MSTINKTDAIIDTARGTYAREIDPSIVNESATRVCMVTTSDGTIILKTSYLEGIIQ